MATHTCKAPGCTEVINSTLLMCPPHWRLVPATVKSDVNRTWRARYRGPGFMKAYIVARAQAIRSVTPQPELRLT
jgi:hypothetical protein